MKKLLAILLVLVFAFSVVACGGESADTSDDKSADFGNNSVDEPSEDESSADVSDDTSDDTSDEGNDAPALEMISQFITWKNAFYNGGIVGTTAYDLTSLFLHKLNASVEAGENGVFTRAYGTSIKDEGQDYADFAVVVFEYNHALFGYVKTSFAAVGSANAETAIPEDGFVAVIHSDNEGQISAIEALSAETVFFPKGFAVNTELDATINSAATAPVLDGNVTEEEYGAAIWDLNPDSKLACYGQFEAGNYNATAKVYLTYDAEKLYCGIIVKTPDHFCDLAADNAVGMWEKTCIQFNICSVDPRGDYMMEGKWDQDGGVHDAANSNILRQMGVAVNNDGESLKTPFFCINQIDNMETFNVRNNETQTTVYEFAVPWSDIGLEGETFVAEAGTVFGFSISVNSGTETRKFQTIALRDGGGIIGTNDWTKIPAITLGE